jgi:tight adherence protein C
MTLRELGALGIGITIGLALLLAFPTTFGIVLGGFTALVMWRMPNIFLARAIRARKASIARDLPDFLDILAVTVQAGLAMNAAMLQSADTTEGALRSELDSTLAEIRIGRQRSDSMIALAQRVNEQTMTTTVTAVVQAEKLGSSLSDVLAELAKDARDRRWLLAEERAAKLPVTMIIPMALFMIPSLYLMIFGPVVATLVHP